MAKTAKTPATKKKTAAAKRFAVGRADAPKGWRYFPDKASAKKAAKDRAGAEVFVVTK